MPAQHDVFSAVCNALLGALNGSGFTLRNLNVTALADTRKQSALTGLISMVQNTHFLIEGCTFLHLAAINSSGVPAPAIMDRAVSTFTMGAQNVATTQFESQRYDTYTVRSRYRSSLHSWRRRVSCGIIYGRLDAKGFTWTDPTFR